MSLGVLILVLAVGLVGLCSTLILFAAFVCGAAADAKAIVEARCAREDQDRARREEAHAYEDALMLRLRRYRERQAEQLGAEAEAFLQEVTR